jgi:hypothetical protein
MGILDLGSRESLFDVKIQSGQREDDAYWGRVDGRRSLSNLGVNDVLEYEVLPAHRVHVEFVGSLRQVGWHEPDHA